MLELILKNYGEVEYKVVGDTYPEIKSKLLNYLRLKNGKEGYNGNKRKNKRRR